MMSGQGRPCATRAAGCGACARPSAAVHLTVQTPARNARHQAPAPPAVVKAAASRRTHVRVSSAEVSAASTVSSSEGEATAPVAVAPPRARLSPADLASWDACVALLAPLGYGQDDSDKMLGRAFGWTTQAFWRKEKVRGGVYWAARCWEACWELPMRGTWELRRPV